MPAENCQVRTLRISDRSIARLEVSSALAETPRGSMETMASLDSIFDTTLVKRSLTDRCNPTGVPFRLAISRLGSNRSILSAKIALEFASMNRTEAIEIDDALIVEDLSAREVSSIQGEARKWPHLQDISFFSLEDKERTILVGCYVPDARRVMR